MQRVELNMSRKGYRSVTEYTGIGNGAIGESHQVHRDLLHRVYSREGYSSTSEYSEIGYGAV